MSMKTQKKCEQRAQKCANKRLSPITRERVNFVWVKFVWAWGGCTTRIARKASRRCGPLCEALNALEIHVSSMWGLCAGCCCSGVCRSRRYDAKWKSCFVNIFRCGSPSELFGQILFFFFSFSFTGCDSQALDLSAYFFPAPRLIFCFPFFLLVSFPLKLAIRVYDAPKIHTKMKTTNTQKNNRFECWEKKKKKKRNVMFWKRFVSLFDCGKVPGSTECVVQSKTYWMDRIRNTMDWQHYEQNWNWIDETCEQRTTKWAQQILHHCNRNEWRKNNDDKTDRPNQVE